jgi:crossover junction endodeoxyribonuclease RuvC
LLSIAEASVTFAEYSATEVKMSVVGYGRAEKNQVQQMVASILRLPSIIPSEDASDALALAICHANNQTMKALTMGAPVRRALQGAL